MTRHASKSKPRIKTSNSPISKLKRSFFYWLSSVGFFLLLLPLVEEVSDHIDGQREDDRRVLLSGYRVQSLKGQSRIN